MEISVIGISYRTAAVEVREQYSLPPELAAPLLRIVGKERIFEEALVLDTCNRTEVYGVTTGKSLPAEHLLRHIANLKGAKPASGAPPVYHHVGMAAVVHLFRVAAGLDSQVVGEHEILGQVKDAYRLALEAHAAHFLMNRLMHRAFRVGKRVRTETRLGQGVTSVAESAVELSRRALRDLSERTVLLIGAGQTGQQAAQSLLRSGATDLIIANRTPAKAEQLAGQFSSALQRGEAGCPAVRRKGTRCSLAGHPAAPGGEERTIRVIPLSEIPSVIDRVDLIIGAASSPEPVLTFDRFRGMRRAERRPLLIMDLAVPRGVDPRLGKIPNVILHNVDDLDRIVADNVERRREEIPRAEAIVSEEARSFEQWLESLDVVRVIKHLRTKVTALEDAEVERYRRKFSAADRDQLELFARGLCNKLLREPIAFLRGSTKHGGRAAELSDIAVVRRMFRLDSGKDDR